MVYGLRLPRVTLAIVLLLASATLAEAQYRAALQGTVIDSTGGAIPVAIIVGVERHFVTRDAGVERLLKSSGSWPVRIGFTAPGRTTSMGGRGRPSRTSDPMTMAPIRSRPRS